MRERILTVNDPSWRTVLPSTVSVFGSVEYAQISEQHTGYSARLYIIEWARGAIAAPFFLRSIDGLPFVSEIDRGLFDTLTPEYTGPLTRGEVSGTFAADFVKHFEAYCQHQGIIAEFAHLHPWTCRVDCLHGEDVSPDREIVYVDLTLKEEQLWNNSLSYACRKNIKRAKKEQVRVFPATQVGDVREFYRIYVHTMDRNQALNKYYFPFDYFLALFEQMPDHARFALAEYHGEIVAGTLYLHDDLDVYSYLGGTDQAFQQIRPTNAVVFDTIQWAQRLGRRRLILGGGYTPDDGIFRFKSSFSPLRACFRVYRHIHLPDRFSELCTAWSNHYDSPISTDGYFPAYRALPQTVTEMNES